MTTRLVTAVTSMALAISIALPIEAEASPDTGYLAGSVVPTVFAMTATGSGYDRDDDDDDCDDDDDDDYRSKSSSSSDDDDDDDDSCSAPPQTQDCRFTQGFWQNRAAKKPGAAQDIWLAIRGQAFYSSGKTYAQALEVSPRGNAYWILAHQMIAAQANAFLGADTEGAAFSALVRANQLMQTLTPAQVASLSKRHPVRAEMISLAGTLDKWNNRQIGTGRCVTPV